MKFIERNISKEYLDEIRKFLDEFNLKNEFIFKTSGSTSEPKKIILSKTQLVSSAQKTIQFFDIKESSSILVCLNPAFIASKMQIIRALCANSTIIITNPSVESIIEINDKIDFAAYVPLQFQKILACDNGIDFLEKHQNILLGGSNINFNLLKRIENLHVPVYQSFGMTETASHIALRRLNGNEKSNYYSILENVEIDININKCLKIKSDVTNNQWIQTTDVVNIINKTQFEWIGRSDFVINSGGIKIHPESVEKEISAYFASKNTTFNFIISSKNDENLGNKVVLVIEKEILSDNILYELSKTLPLYHSPKEIITIEKMPLNENGKISRMKVRELINT